MFTGFIAMIFALIFQKAMTRATDAIVDKVVDKATEEICIATKYIEEKFEGKKKPTNDNNDEPKN